MGSGITPPTALVPRDVIGEDTTAYAAVAAMECGDLVANLNVDDLDQRRNISDAARPEQEVHVLRICGSQDPDGTAERSGNVDAHGTEPLVVRGYNSYAATEEQIAEAITPNNGAASVVSHTNTSRTLSAAEVAELDDSGTVQAEAEAVRSVGSLTGQIALTLCAVAKTDGSIVFLITGAVFYVLAIIPVLLSPKSFCVKHASDYAETPTVVNFTRTFVLRVVSLVRSLIEKGNGAVRLDTAVFIAIVAFVIILTAMPSGGTMYSYYTSDITESLPDWFFQLQYCFSLVGALIGCFAYRRWFAKWPVWNVFALAAAAGFVSYATNILFSTGVTTTKMHIPVSVFVCFDAVLSGAAARISYVPIVHVAASIAPKGYEATAFDVFTTAGMVGPTLSTIFSVRLAKAMRVTAIDFSNLTWFLVVCAVTQLAPMVLLLAARMIRLSNFRIFA